MKLLQPRPFGSGPDTLSRAPCDAEIGCDKPVDSPIRADGAHIGLRQSRLPLTPASIAGAVRHTMELVLRSRDPSKIGKRRIPRVAVEVSRFMLRRARADKRLKDECVDIPLAAGAKLHDSIPGNGLLWDQNTADKLPRDFASPSALAANFAGFTAHIPKAGNRVAGTPRNRAPFFSGGAFNHHCIIGANA